MSIGSSLSALQTAKSDIATAITAAGGTVDAGDGFADFAADIATIPEGGGGVTASDVNFYDYNGTLVASYTFAEAASLNALPTTPTHTGLTFQEWNYTLAQVNAVTLKTDVGATYTTDDGKTRLYITINSALHVTVPLYFSQTVANGVTIDWGDNSATQTLSGTGDKNTSHAYAAAGDYVITLDVAVGCAAGLGATATNGIFGAYGNGNGTIYTYMLKKVEIGARVTTINNRCFSGCIKLSIVVLPNSITTFGTYSFLTNKSLKCVILPSGISSIPQGAFAESIKLSRVSIPLSVTSIADYSFIYSYSLQNIYLPSSVSSIGNNTFNNCYSLVEVVHDLTTAGSNSFRDSPNVKTTTNSITTYGDSAFNSTAIDSIVIAAGVTNAKTYTFYGCQKVININIPAGYLAIGDELFGHCRGVETLTVPASVTSIAAGAFDSMTGMKEYHFLPTTPPTLANSNAFYDIPSDCVIYVPSASLSAYQSATNWSTQASKMVGE